MRSWNEVVGEHQRVLTGLAGAGAVLDPIAIGLIQRLRDGGRIYLAGNGGSAADAQHIAAELIGRFRRNRRALPAIALTTDTSALTAIGNDYGFERVFARQVEALVTARDVLWLLSTSGTSVNILEAAATARTIGALVIAFTGESGGKLAPLCQHAFRVPHTMSDRIQEAHALAYHYVCERIESAFAA